MEVILRAYTPSDLPKMIEIWNVVVQDGNSFPQTEPLTLQQASLFFKEQTYTGVAVIEKQIVGLYILHPNNIGRCGHICNASYAVKQGIRGQGIGGKLVEHSLKIAKEKKFRIMQFNAVLAINTTAVYLYERLGFTPLNIIPGGFLLPTGEYTDIIPFYKELI